MPIPPVFPDTSLNVRLLTAVQQGDLEAVRILLAQGANADAQVQWPGQTERFPLVHMAARSSVTDYPQYLPLFRLLVAHCQDVNASDAGGSTLLMRAVHMNDLETVQQLVARGADVHAQARQHFVGANALFLAVMEQANSGPDPSPITQFLLDQGANVNVQVEGGDTPLMVAAQFGRIETVKALLARGANPARMDARGLTALQRAARLRGRADVVRLLEAATQMGLHEAAQFGNMARVRELLDAGENVNAPNPDTQTPLMAAMIAQSADVARLLLERGAALHTQDRMGRTALHHAALYGNAPAAALLLDYGANVNAAMPEARLHSLYTPLLYAVEQAEADVVDLLIERGVDLVENEQGARALELVMQSAGHRTRRPLYAPDHASDAALLDTQDRIIHRLLEAGADPRAHDSRALFLAARNAQAGLVILLLDSGADVDGRSRVGPQGGLDHGQTALMGAIDAWYMVFATRYVRASPSRFSSPEQGDDREEEAAARETISLLLAHGANVNAAAANGITPLMQCRVTGMLGLAETLLARGANINAADKKGRTALMQAAAQSDNGDDDIAAFLLAHGADVNRQDGTGRTALMLAIDDGSNEAARAMHEWAGGYIHEAHGGEMPLPREELPNPDGHPDMVALLLRYGADTTQPAKDGTTPLLLAQQNKFDAILALLRPTGAE